MNEIEKTLSQLTISKFKEIEKLEYENLELKDALFDIVLQFAYHSAKWGTECLHDGGLSALEKAFYTLGYEKGIVSLSKFLKDWAKIEKELTK